jgi:tetratricopeptide (TPR) repeat protein
MAAASSTVHNRDELFAALDQTFDRVRQNNISEAVALVGSAGIGKSSMVEEWLEGHQDNRLVRSWIPHEPATTFRPVGDIVEKCLGITPQDDLDAVRLRIQQAAGLDDLVRRRLAHVAGDDGEMFPSHEIFWAVRRLLAAMSQDRPLLVVLDGVERAESTFLDMLEYLPGYRGAVLIICIANRSLLKARPNWQMPHGEPEVRSVIIEPPDGFVREESNFEGRESLENEVLLTASTLGEAFPLSALLTLGSSQSSEDIQQAVGKLVVDEVLTVLWDGQQDVVAFRRGGDRMQIYDAMDDVQAVELHERIGTYWETLGGPGRRSFDELSAWHLEQAVEFGRRRPKEDLVRRAVRRLASSGRRALARSDAPAASDLLERAIFLMPEGDDRRVNLLLDLCDALLDLGDLQRISRLAQAGLDEAIDSKDHMIAHRFDIWKRVVRSRLGDAGAVDEELSDVEIATALERVGDNRGAAEAQVLVAERLWEDFDYDGAVATLDQALFNARAAANRRLQSKIGAWLLFAFFWGSMPADEAERRCNSMPFDFTRDRLLEANRLTTLGGALGLRGEFSTGRGHLLEARTLQQELGQPLVISFNPQVAGTVALLAEDFEQAESDFRLGFEEAQRVADPGHAASSAALLSKALFEQGRHDEAMRFSRIAEQASFGTPEMSQGEWKTTRARLQAQKGGVDEAIDVLQRVISMYPAKAVPRDRADALLDLAEVLELGGRTDEARAALGEAQELYEAKGVLPAVERVKQRLA